MTDNEVHYSVPSNIPIENRSSRGCEFAKLLKLQLIKYTRSRKLICSNNFMLQLMQAGRVNGTQDSKNPLVNLQVISIGANMIAFWGRESEMYLAVSPKGEVYASQQEGRDCVFVESFTHSYYNTYETFHTVNKSIHKYLTINQNGRVTLSDQISSDSMFYWELPKEIPEKMQDENNNEIDATYVNI